MPVAGADRMKLMDQLAVQDLVALADTLLMPEDDLALAVVLKSPLFGFDDEDLFELAYDRSGSLWSALKDKAAEDPRFAGPAAQLAHLAGPRRSPAALRVLLRAARRRRQRLRRACCAARAGSGRGDRRVPRPRARFRPRAPPSLQGFVNQLRAGDVEIKRDMEQQRDEVRIMTVHGAKGLQAPIVFLPDTCSSRAQCKRRGFIRCRGQASRPTKSVISCGRAARTSTIATLDDAKARCGRARARGISPPALCGDDAGARTGSMSAAGRASKNPKTKCLVRADQDGLGASPSRMRALTVGRCGDMESGADEAR